MNPSLDSVAMCASITDEQGDDRCERGIQRKQVNAALALRQVVEDQHGQEPHHEITQAWVEPPRHSNPLNRSRERDRRPRHEACYQGALLVIERMRVALIEAPAV